METQLSPSSAAPAVEEPFFGLVELDPAGTIVYARIECMAERPGIQAFRGINFFRDLRPFENVDEFRELVHRFADSRLPADCYDFVCYGGNNTSYTSRVSISRISERSDQGATKSFLIQFKPAT